MNTKRCNQPDCTWKTLDQFSKNVQTKDGLCGMCKSCYNERYSSKKHKIVWTEDPIIRTDKHSYTYGRKPMPKEWIEALERMENGQDRFGKPKR